MCYYNKILNVFTMYLGHTLYLHFLRITFSHSKPIILHYPQLNKADYAGINLLFLRSESLMICVLGQGVLDWDPYKMSLRCNLHMQTAASRRFLPSARQEMNKDGAAQL